MPSEYPGLSAIIDLLETTPVSHPESKWARVIFVNERGDLSASFTLPIKIALEVTEMSFDDKQVIGIAYLEPGEDPSTPITEL